MEGLIKEMNLSEMKMFACQATDVIKGRFIEVVVQSIDDILGCRSSFTKHVLRLQGSETDGPVGMAHVTVSDGGHVKAHVVLDHSRPERLLAEIGELGIEIYYTFDIEKDNVGVGRGTDKKTIVCISNIVPTRAELRSIGADTKVDGDNKVRRLKPVEWVWDF